MSENKVDLLEIPIHSHPIYEGHYLIPTNSVYDASAHAIRWVKNRVPGAIIYGDPRLGKTGATELIEIILKAELGQHIPIFHLSINYAPKASEARFFKDILTDLKSPFVNQGKGEDKRQRIIEFLIEATRASGQTRLIIFIDDAQRLTFQQYEWLMDIYNPLHKVRIIPTFILFSQPEILHTRTSLMQSNSNHIVGRFMVDYQPFYGIRSEKDLDTCLKAYDEVLEFPLGSGYSYTEFFFKEAYDANHRLSKCTKLLFNKIVELRDRNKITGPLNIPMQYFRDMVDTCFREFGRGGEGLIWPGAEQWEYAILNSDYLKNEYVNTSNKASL